jgi:hypothetical protein
MFLHLDENMNNLINLSLNQALNSLTQENANIISKSRNGITWILELLTYWEKQGTLFFFDWEFLAQTERTFLEWMKENQKYKWNRIPNHIIENVWLQTDQKI